MKNFPILVLFSVMLPLSSFSTSAAELIAHPAPTEKLESAVYDWDKLVVAPTATGVRRTVFDGPSDTVDKAHCHISTLNPGERSGEPRKHLQEEIIYVREGQVEANYDGHSQIAGPRLGDFFRSGCDHFPAQRRQNPRFVSRRLLSDAAHAEELTVRNSSRSSFRNFEGGHEHEANFELD